MSQIKKKSLLFSTLFLLSVFFIAGCGSPNSQSNLDPVSGKHIAGWLPDGHMAVAKIQVDTCTQCHGADYAGGISRVACTNCHIGNQQSIHPTSWGPFGYILHASYVGTNGNSSCANALCHGAGLDGAGGTGPSCTSCHMGGVAAMHPTAWGSSINTLHGSYANLNGTAACANAKCHGAGLDGIGGSGPSCTLCHLGGVSAIHPTAWGSSINTLHGSYTKLNGTTACANAACHGAALTGVSGSGSSCNICHLGSSGSIHPTQWLPYVYALHGSYAKVNGTTACANVLCHGAALAGVSGSGPSCTLCHMGGVSSIHPAEWNDSTLANAFSFHQTRAGYTNYDSCKNIACHGAALEGVYLSGHSCYLCHVTLP